MPYVVIGSGDDKELVWQDDALPPAPEFTAEPPAPVNFTVSGSGDEKTFDFRPWREPEAPAPVMDYGAAGYVSGDAADYGNGRVLIGDTFYLQTGEAPAPALSQTQIGAALAQQTIYTPEYGWIAPQATQAAYVEATAPSRDFITRWADSGGVFNTLAAAFLAPTAIADAWAAASYGGVGATTASGMAAGTIPLDLSAVAAADAAGSFITESALTVFNAPELQALASTGSETGEVLYAVSDGAPIVEGAADIVKEIVTVPDVPDFLDELETAVQAAGEGVTWAPPAPTFGAPAGAATGAATALKTALSVVGAATGVVSAATGAAQAALKANGAPGRSASLASSAPGSVPGLMIAGDPAASGAGRSQYIGLATAAAVVTIGALFVMSKKRKGKK